MTLTRLLLASTAISLSGFGFSHAAPFPQAPLLNAPTPAAMEHLIRVQMSAADAEAALAAARERLAAAEASGGDVATAQAEVAAAQARLEAARTAPAPEPAPAPAEAPAAAEPAAEPQAAEEAPAEPAPEVVPEPVPEPEPAPEPEPEPAPAPEPAPNPEPEPEPEPETPEAPDTPAATEAPAPAEAPAADADVTSEPAPTPEPKPAVEPETPAAPATEAPAEPAPDAAEPAPAAPAEPDATEAQAPTPEPKPASEPETPAAPATETPAEAAPDAAEPAPAAPAEPDATEAQAPTPEPKPASEPETPAAPATETPAEAAPAAAPEASAPVEQDVQTLPVPDGAPVLDSAKEQPVEGDPNSPAPAPAPSEPAAPAPTSDAEAQAPASRSEPAPQALSERGERMREQPAPEIQTDVTIVNQIDNRTIIEVDNRTIIEHDERDRLRAGSEEVYYESLRGGRTREVIVRPNGVQLVTITNRWGDVIQRSRIMPDGQEYVLFYANANSDGSRNAFVDPGRELPPLRLSIPISDYILDATGAEPSAFLDFLMEPPVEQVERLYSVEEVRRSARVRDKVRRIDLDSLTFEFGKATIAEDQIQRLSDVADAITEILARNPAETFLIEGHTDAVGRDAANLLLSDKRAETIAVALSDVFGIPPENLVTQGYGERYLKVRTEAPERLNRRVTIRRITPLVTPVASR
ncbi:OmpA family protein [Hoeflea sp. YIM 152468]|uniref:OmpA family protein n=1 Tax=Hoeflea sp. YIM 152468 TaxID=3031759 RepID=UPI0023D9A90B|nr:OmpA family protein [Hoeflea sp. YIM 152468]MDF1607067.1 OmpA family protein [Hoeflea sp. YIM 152468]